MIARVRDGPLGPFQEAYTRLPLALTASAGLSFHATRPLVETGADQVLP